MSVTSGGVAALAAALVDAACRNRVELHLGCWWRRGMDWDCAVGSSLCRLRLRSAVSARAKEKGRTWYAAFLLFLAPFPLLLSHWARVSYLK